MILEAVQIGDRRAECKSMHAEYLELSRALLHWSRKQPLEIAIKAELLAFGLELLVDQPDYIPLRQLIKMNAADLVTLVRHTGRPLVLPPQSSVSADVSASPGPDAGLLSPHHA